MQPITRLFLLFAISGFAGIIYESIWSHYLKLLLGHAAYAQTIVLIIFMGGMAAGSWLGSRLEKRVADPLIVYALIEITVGVIAMVFHPIYTESTQFALATIFPYLGDPMLIDGAKVAISAALVLPQSLLLGMTFPMMTVGILKRGVLPSGFTVSNLYFVNSLGAAIGVLSSGFVFIALLGLPGTIRLAGCLNIAIALAVYLVAKRMPLQAAVTKHESEATKTPSNENHQRRLILAAAAMTGCASFIYEISWIRMLNMVLGASTHSFELMLSAFILGLAIGGWWIRRHLDRVQHLLSLLGFIQIAMGVLAVSTLAFYDFSFIAMSMIFHAVATTPLGYGLFMIFSNGIAFMIMLPATICAGMTLPILTHYLLKSGAGNRSVGEVYAANTGGAIVGVIVTVHLLLPLLGLKFALLIGASIDLLLGAYLLRAFVARHDVSAARVAVMSALVFTLISVMVVELDPLKMSAGVFRHGTPALDDDVVMAMRRDGKSASVSVFRTGTSTLVIATNGKPDASLEFNPGLPPSRDEHTQVLTGALPMLLKPRMRRTAVIGIGSGMTTHVLLQNPNLEVIDTIEIEAEMVAGAKHFRPHVEATFTDPRSRIHIDDARTFFASRGAVYDAIVSEPSNPWVAGVSGLFSIEFYRQIKRHLAADGVFVQWLQLYEIDLGLLASVFKAFGEHFPHYCVFEMDDGNLLLVAENSNRNNDLSGAEAVFEMGDMRALLARIGMQSPSELRARYLASSSILQPFFANYPLPANSDFHPVLDLNAAYKRFLAAESRNFGGFARAKVPLREMLGDRALSTHDIGLHEQTPYRTLRALSHARILGDWLLLGDRSQIHSLPKNLALRAELLDSGPGCIDDIARELWLDALVQVAGATLSMLDPARATALISKLGARGCRLEDSHSERWLALLRAIAARDALAMRDNAKQLIDNADSALTKAHRTLLFEAYLLANVILGPPAENLVFWDGLSEKERASVADSMAIKILRGHSGDRSL